MNSQQSTAQLCVFVKKKKKKLSGLLQAIKGCNLFMLEENNTCCSSWHTLLFEIMGILQCASVNSFLSF